MTKLGFVKLFVASGADVLEGLTLLVFVVVRVLLRTGFVVKIDADLVLSHKEFGDPVYILFALLLFAGLVVGRTTRIVLGLPSVRKGVLLRKLREPGPDVLESGFNERPIVPLKFPHHPSHHHLMAGIENLLVRVMKGHRNQKLRECELVRQLFIKFNGWSFRQDFRQHAVHQLMNCQILVSG